MHFEWKMCDPTHLCTVHGVLASAFCLCNAPSATHSCSRSSAHPSRTPASPACASRWRRSDCLCPRSATAMIKNMAPWLNNGVTHENSNWTYNFIPNTLKRNIGLCHGLIIYHVNQRNTEPWENRADPQRDTWRGISATCTWYFGVFGLKTWRRLCSDIHSLQVNSRNVQWNSAGAG